MRRIKPHGFKHVHAMHELQVTAHKIQSRATNQSHRCLVECKRVEWFSSLNLIKMRRETGFKNLGPPFPVHSHGHHTRFNL